LFIWCLNKWIKKALDMLETKAIGFQTRREASL